MSHSPNSEAAECVVVGNASSKEINFFVDALNGRKIFPSSPSSMEDGARKLCRVDREKVGISKKPPAASIMGDKHYFAAQPKGDSGFPSGSPLPATHKSDHRR